MTLSTETLARAARLVLPLARSWRFRDASDPSRPPDRALRPAVYALWHEGLLPAAVLYAGQGAGVLTSRHRDGEIISRILIELGYLPLRGSSTRGGAEGLRAMIRAGRAGRPLAFTPDGPRGPARRSKPGVIAAATGAGLPIIPVGLAATRGRRLNSWDGFLVPAPGAVVLVSQGAPIPPGRADDPTEVLRQLDAAITRELELCEARARLLRRGVSLPPVRVVSPVRLVVPPTGAVEAPAADVHPGADVDPAAGVHPAARARPAAGVHPVPGAVRALSARGRIALEARVRAAWKGRPPAWLRGAAALFGLAAEARHFAYDAGLVRPHPAPLPVISVGGLTVGGSGKTPIAAAVGRWLTDAGHAVAVLTRGYADEVALHRTLNPEARVWGHPDRLAVARLAKESGARVVVLDDGFQHRRLARDLEIVVLDLDALRRTNRRRLPAGPFRERLGALARADAIVLAGREAATEVADELAEWADRRLPGVPVVRCELRSAGPAPANRAALARHGMDDVRPKVALTGIMKPHLFFDLVGPSVEERYALPDHHSPTPAELDRHLSSAGEHGVVMTLKDIARFGDMVPPDVPLWYLEERLEWEHDGLRRRVLATVEA